MSKVDPKSNSIGLPASEWVNAFRSAKVQLERLDAAKSAQGRATIIGNFLARMVNREVRIEVDGRTGTATLRSRSARSRKQLYYFEVRLDDQDDSASDTQGPAGGNRFGEKQRREPKKLKVDARDNPIDRSPAIGVIGAGNSEQW